MSSLCIEAVARSNEEYTQGMKKLANLIKPGGTLLIFGHGELPGEDGFYVVGEEKFRGFGVAQDAALEAVRSAGVSVVTTSTIPHTVAGSCITSFIFIHGIKEGH